MALVEILYDIDCLTDQIKHIKFQHIPREQNYLSDFLAKSDSSLLRLRGAEARGPFCCPRMVNCSSVCQGFPSCCVNCKCICDVRVDDAPDASPPMADVYFGNQQLD
ncbi:hypothetical protein V6N13_068952 [Hibiscus sabdariffa]